MTWSLINSFKNDAHYTGSSFAGPLPITVSGISVGDLLVVTFQYGAGSDKGTTLTTSDNAGTPNTYTRETTLYTSGDQQGAARFSAPVGNVTSLTTVSIDWLSANLTFTSAVVEQWRNSGGSVSGTVISGTPAAQNQASPGTGTDGITSGNTTPAVDGCLIHGSLVFPGSTPTTITHGTGFTTSVDDFATAALITEALTQTTAAAIAATFTETGSSNATMTFVTAYAPPAGGPTTKSDTDTGTLSEQTPAIKVATPTDTATLTEQVPRISPTAQTDSLTFSETQTVTTSSAVSKTDTDTASLTETTNPPVIGVTDSATLNDTAITLVVTDVQQVPDFTVTEQTPRIGLSLADSLAFSETEKLTASFIRFVDSDAFGLAEATTPMASISQRDTASLTETQAGTTYILDADTLSQSDAAAVTALLTSLDALTFADTETRNIIGGYTGYAKGHLSVGARLAGTATVGTRLAGTTATGSRLKGTTTVQPVGGP